MQAKGFTLRNRMTESTCEIIAADVAGSHGARPDVLILNELSHIQKKEFAENLLDNSAKVPRGLVCIASNAGFQDTWQWRWRERARISDRWCFHRYAQPAPWLSPDDIEEAKIRNSANRQARLFHGSWLAENEADALDSEVIDAAITLKGPTIKREDGRMVCTGVDLALTRDNSAVVTIAKHVGWCEEITTRKQRTPAQAALVGLGILDGDDETESVFHDGSGRIKLVDVKLWKPEKGKRLSVTAVEEYIEKLHRRLGLSEVAVDPWQAAMLCERLDEKGVPVRQVSFTGANLQTMASAVLESFNEGTIDLYNDKHLIADLRRLRVVEKSYGVRLASPHTNTNSSDGPGSAHGDVATALALSLLSARTHSHIPNRINRELVCYP